MTFDWFVLAAQLLNFAVLLVLLRIFLYRPVLSVLAQREERVMAVQAEADAAREEAEAVREGVLAEREALEAEFRRQRAKEAAELSRERERRLSEVERELASARAAAKGALERDHRELVAELTRHTSRLVVAELRRALTGLADARLEAKTVAVLRRRVTELDDATRAALREASADNEVLIYTAFQLPPGARADLTAVATELAGRAVEPRFDVDPRLIFGAVIQVGAYRVGWEAEGFADELERALLAKSDATGGEVAPGSGGPLP